MTARRVLLRVAENRGKMLMSGRYVTMYGQNYRQR
jgi:hypothetical protein